MQNQELKETQQPMPQNRQQLKPERKSNVPLFINEGDKIKIDTATGSSIGTC